VDRRRRARAGAGDTREGIRDLAEGGGSIVAAIMEAKRIAPDSHDLPERVLLNIVEEMAIASGISIPLAYVMHRQSGINAFAAGYSPNEAVVVLSRGALQKLNRDELQGEFKTPYDSTNPGSDQETDNYSYLHGRAAMALAGGAGDTAREIPAMGEAHSAGGHQGGGLA